MHTMMENESSWECHQTFLNVLETGSLSAAGRALGLTQPTVGRHIDSSETALALKLFTRSFDGFAPTDVAHELKPYAAIAAALRRVASSHGSGVRGTVRLTASEIIGIEVLPPILAARHGKHPALIFELVLSNKVDDLLHREADIAVRMLRPTQQALLAKRVAGIGLGLYARKAYLRMHGTPESTDALSGHAIIGFDQGTSFIRKFQEQFSMFSRAALAFRANSDLAQLGAIRAGFGIGVCQVTLAAKDKRLNCVLKSRFSLTMDTWGAMHNDLRQSPRCAATFAALAAGLSAYMQRS